MAAASHRGVRLFDGGGEMTLDRISKIVKSLGRFVIAIKSWLIGGPGDDARVAALYRYRDGQQRPCPGPYALLAGVARR
jgi:hypothetical protein